MFKLKLISADISYNYIEKGDRLFVTAKFQNIGDTPLDSTAQIAADLIFCNRHRREQNQNTNFRFNWEPAPQFNCFKSGEVWSTTGAWLVEQTWGASFEVRISVFGKDGEPISFIGKDGKEVFAQSIGEVDLGWGWGRGRLLQQRRKLHADFNAVSDMPIKAPQSGVTFGDYIIGANYPQFLGYKGEKWADIIPYITERNIDTNKIVTYSVADINCALKSNDGTTAVYGIATKNTAADIVIKSFEDKITLGVENLKQNPPYELCSVIFPNIAQSSADDAIMTNYFGGGREVAVKNTLPQSVSFIFDTCNALTAGNKELTFCVNAVDADNILIQSVIMDSSDKKSAVIGAEIVVNMPANKAGMRSIPIDVVPLDIYALKDGSWKSSAFILQSMLPDNPKETYKDTFVYKTNGDSSAQYNPDDPATWTSDCRPIEEIDRRIEQIAKISDDIKQVVYIVGWQKGGHDFEYPYPYRYGFNPRIGTIEQYKAMVQKYLKRGVAVSFHDNFDDNYLSKYHVFDENIMARDEYGDVFRGWLWCGGISFITSPTKYVEMGEIDNRIKSTIKQFDIDKVGTYHLDVLTSENRRYDYTQDNMSSAQQNIEAKKKIVKKFNEYGVDVTSETMCHPFLDTIGFAQNMRCLPKGELFFGDRFVPLTTLAMHGAIPYPYGVSDDRSLLMALVLGSANGHQKNTPTFTMQQIAESIYLHFLPMSKFTYKKIVDMEYTDKMAKVCYGEGSYITANFTDNSYEVVRSGKKISWNYNTVIDYMDKYYVYSRNGGNFEVELGDGWDTAKIIPLSLEGRGEAVTVNVQGGKITVNAAPATPYVIIK